MKLKRQITISPAYDKRSTDPKKNYGICACRIFFAVIGNKGAVTVNFGTNWYLPSTIKDYKENGCNGRKIDLVAQLEPIRNWSWDYHSKKQKYKGQPPMKDCEFTGGKCYCDGSCMRSDKYLTLLLEKGSDGVFEQLEKDYKIEFS